jgi:hypothetical protein
MPLGQRIKRPIAKRIAARVFRKVFPAMFAADEHETRYLQLRYIVASGSA